MQWCQQHWDGLRAEIERQGLTGFVASSGRVAAEQFSRAVSGEESLDTFDPLMGAHWAINAFIAEQMGPGGFLTLMAYEGCPICKADEVHQAHCDVNGPGCTDSYARYFPNAVEDQRKRLDSLSRPTEGDEQ